MNNISDQELKELEQATVAKMEKLVGFVKYIVALAATLFAILASLRPNAGIPFAARIVYASSLFLLSLCVLSGCIAIFAEVRLATLRVRTMKESILQKLHGKRPARISSLNAGKIFDLCTMGTYLLFAFAIIGLAAFVLVTAI